MGFFRRKDSKSTSPEQTKSIYSSPSVYTVSSDKLSQYSTKSSKQIATIATIHTTMANSIPEIEIPEPPDPRGRPAAYLRSIHAVRERSTIVLERAKVNQLNHFDVDMTKFQDTADYVTSIIRRDFSGDYSSIPPHGRWQHFEVGGRPRITHLLQSWASAVDSTERTRRLIDLFVVSVLLDAGAGSRWSYKSKESSKTYSRSEGLAVASLEMFKAGIFSSDPSQPHQVDASALQKLTPDILAKGMQVSETNPMSGLEGRANLLIRLGSALGTNKAMFGKDARPGNMIDYLISHHDTVAAAVPIVPLPVLWSVLMDGLSSIWPATRTTIDGMSLGDAWPCSAMPAPGSELMTGLPEYRNGGLLVDTGLLTLKEKDVARGLQTYHQIMPHSSVEVVPMFEPSDDVIVEWRATTVGFLDELLAAVNSGLGLTGGNKLSLAQMLEAGTWKGGREVAQVSRPITGGPPIGIISDGTIF